MPPVPNFSDELSLLSCLLMNAAAFGSAYFFSRRKMTLRRSQALLDAALIGYAIQYMSVGLPGLLGGLNYPSVISVAVICAAMLIAAAWKTKPTPSAIPTRDRFVVASVALFAASFVLAFAHRQSDLPPISNDAMTYHFPAAVQWLQREKISLFQTWFFNPSNTYSPLAGSIFILWLILPFGGDFLARFVEVPALLCVGLAIYRLCRQIDVRSSVAALIAAAAVLCRPLFLPSIMGKDDLFVAFFMIASLVALSRDRASERWGAVRFGISLGLLLATKYTAWLSVPILLFAFDGPKWPVKKWMIAGSTALMLAGPWYLRNWLTTGNPVFPLCSLFTVARSDEFHSIYGALNAVIEGSFGLPLWIAVLATIALVISSALSVRMPILRACSVGSLVAILTFFWRSPFPEVRFLLPVISLLFACIAFLIQRGCRDERLAILAGVAMVGLSLATLFPGLFMTVALPFTTGGVMVAAIAWAAMVWGGSHRTRKILIVGIAMTAFFVFTYINWSSFCAYQRRTRFVDGAGYSAEYPDLTRIWNFVDQHIPADATVAYTNLYFVYPLQGGLLDRRLIYVPTRRGVESIADLGWLGKNLSGEQLVSAAIRATAVSPDRSVWMSNLRASGAQYLVVGRSKLINSPIEEQFAAADPAEFTLLFEGPAGRVYQVAR